MISRRRAKLKPISAFLGTSRMAATRDFVLAPVYRRRKPAAMASDETILSEASAPVCEREVDSVDSIDVSRSSSPSSLCLLARMLRIDLEMLDVVAFVKGDDGETPARSSFWPTPIWNYLSLAGDYRPKNEWAYKLCNHGRSSGFNHAIEESINWRVNQPLPYLIYSHGITNG